MSDSDIADALFEHLNTLNLSPALPIAWPGRSFNPPTSGAWLRVSFLPGQTTAFAVGHEDSEDHRGLLQVSVFAPADAGQFVALGLADRIRAHFRRGTRLDTEDGIAVRVSSPPYLSPPIDEPNWVQVAVSVPYLAFAPNTA